MNFQAQIKIDQAINQVLQKIERINQFVLDRLTFIGLEFVRNARTNANFTDRTGNLRSSIGFVILKDGLVVSENFELSSNGTDKYTGKSQGEDFAKSLFKQEKGYVLILVAGMKYAAAVESRGFDVITGSGFIVKDDVKELIQGLKKIKL
mgnify:CR=1 FL=1